VDVFAVFQSFDENFTFNPQDQFIIDSQMVMATGASAPRAHVTQPGCLNKRHSVNRKKQRCDICRREFNSDTQALSHFRGASHNEEIIRRALTLQNVQNSA